ncbi:beta-ketoacyl [acyl carrier protein] synthase domain-containing protein [Dyella koreensis]|uniref:Polyketide synthase n=1 Tax=Dyella koreensis TaxID=311235 RepID=A0ABW8K305_9GAMM
MTVIAGMSCHFPGAEGLDAYWRLIKANQSAIETPPSRRDELVRQIDELKIPIWGGYISHEDTFDADRFQIPQREVDCMDPQQKLVLTHACRALEDAGLSADALKGGRVGVFVGAMANDLAYLKWNDLPKVEAANVTGNGLCLIANRLSYELDLHGPSMTVDTACSSSLVAVHQAVRALRDRECDLVLVAGVNVILSALLQKFYQMAGVGSPDGYCRSFSADANGIGRSEGIGVLVLCREQDLPSARQRGYAVVGGSRVNHGGQSSRFTAPNIQAQVALLREAYAEAGIQPHDVAYVEGHGTGTRQGDRMEIKALQEVFDGRESACALGAVKSLIGHTEAASGMAGLIKVALMLHHGYMPASAYADTPAPLLDAASPIQLIPDARPLSPRQVYHMGVSAFGLGGTNAHVVLASHRAA